MTKAERRREHRRALMERGYSTATATAASRLTDELVIGPILKLAGTSGLTDGPARAYYIALMGNIVKACPYPTAPARLSAGDVRFIEDRVRRDRLELEREVDDRRRGRALHAIQ